MYHVTKRLHIVTHGMTTAGVNRTTGRKMWPHLISSASLVACSVLSACAYHGSFRRSMFESANVMAREHFRHACICVLCIAKCLHTHWPAQRNRNTVETMLGECNSDHNICHHCRTCRRSGCTVQAPIYAKLVNGHLYLMKRPKTVNAFRNLPKHLPAPQCNEKCYGSQWFRYSTHFHKGTTMYHSKEIFLTM